MWGLKNMCYQQYFCRWNQVDLRHPTCRAQQVRTSWKQIQDIHVNFWCFVSSRKFILALCKKMNKFATSNNFVAETHILMSKANSKKSQKAVTDGKISLLKISQHSIHQQNDKESTWTSSTIIEQSRDARRTTSAKRDWTHPIWSRAMTLNFFASASKLRKKNPCDAPYPCTKTIVGAFGFPKVTVLIYRASLLVDLNHLTFEPGGPDPMFTCSCTYGVLQNEFRI